jgi:hypothetical protein
MTTLTKQLMAAEIIFDKPDDMTRAMTALTEHGFEVGRIEGLSDPAGTPAAWLLACRDRQRRRHPVLHAR